MLIYQRSDSATALTAGENAWRIKEPSASVECRHCVQTENLTPTYERPALRKLLAAFPAESKVAAASFAVIATVVSISDRLPPAAAASTAEAAAFSSAMRVFRSANEVLVARSSECAPWCALHAPCPSEKIGASMAPSVQVAPGRTRTDC